MDFDISSILNTGFGFLFVLGVVVFFHELGHFMVARWCGVNVNTFSIGFGKEVWGFNDKKGTRWKLSWIPLGGYVKFADDESVASTPNRNNKTATKEEEAGFFHNKPLGSRTAVVAAGPIANFILAIVIYAMIFMTFGRHITEARVDEIRPGSVAEQAGFQVGDVIKSIDGVKIESFDDLRRIVSVSADKPLSFKLDRGGDEFLVTAVPQRKEISDNFGNTQKVGLLGVVRKPVKEEVRLERSGFVDAIWLGTKETWFIAKNTLIFIYDLIMGRQDTDQLGGPIKIAKVSGQMASISFAALLNLTAILSVSIGLFNLFPIPMLDGGHLLFYAFEALRGKPLSERVQEYGFRIGIVILVSIMIFATWNDLT